MSDDDTIEVPERREEAQVADDDGDSNAGASVPGIAFAYSTAKWQIEKQEQTIREVNSRLAFLLAGLLGFSSYYFKDTEHVGSWATVLAGLALIAPIALAALGYLPRGYTRPPNPRGVAREARKQPGAIKEALLGTMLSGFETNKKVIDRKALFFFAALLVSVLELLAGISWKMGAAAVELHGQGVKHGAGTTRATGSSTTKSRDRAGNIYCGTVRSAIRSQRNRSEGTNVPRHQGAPHSTSCHTCGAASVT